LVRKYLSLDQGQHFFYSEKEKKKSIHLEENLGQKRISERFEIFLVKNLFPMDSQRLNNKSVRSELTNDFREKKNSERMKRVGESKILEKIPMIKFSKKSFLKRFLIFLFDFLRKEYLSDKFVKKVRQIQAK